MKSKLTTIKYAFLGLTGILLLSGALWYVPVLPEVEACGNTPNCMGWEVTSDECSGLCSCAGNLISYTCYRQYGVCNSNGANVLFSACYQGGCCCPSGNCAGQGGGGGGGGGGGEGENWCYGNWDCDLGYRCDEFGYCEAEWLQ